MESYFEKSEILVQIDLARKNRVTGSLNKTRQVHLLVKIVHHLFLYKTKMKEVWKTKKLLRGGTLNHEEYCL